jgi:MFS family permease
MAFADSTRALRAVGRSGGMRRVLAAFLVFNVAEWSTWVAMLVFAFQRGGATETGIVAVVQLAPAIVVAPLGSVVGDRIARNRALGFAYGAMAVAMLGAGIALQLHVPAPFVYAMGAVSNAALTLVRPVHNSILPQLSDTPDELTAANSLSSTIEGLSVFLGPVVTGALLATNGAGAVFLISGASMVAAVLLALPVRPRAPSPELQEAGDEVTGDAFEGFRELRREPGAAVLLGLVGAQAIVVGLLDVLAVVLAIEVLGMSAAGPGILTGSLGIGGLLGAAATVTLVGRRKLVPAIGFGVLVSGIALALVALAPGAGAAILLLVASGTGRAFVDVAGRTLLQRTVKDEVLARVFGLQEGMLMLGLTIGSALSPVLVAWLGGRGAFVVAGAILPLLALLAWPRLRGVDRKAILPDAARVELLRALEIFRPLAQPVLERLSWHLIPVAAADGEVIIRQGDPGDLFYVIEAGTVDIHIDGQLVASRGVGEFFGEIALLRDIPRTATVVAATPVTLLALERGEFLAAVTGSPGRHGTATSSFEPV